VIGAAALRAALEQELPAMIAETERLVAIDSGSEDRHGVERVSAEIGELLSARGLTLEREPLPEHAPGLSATLHLGNGPKVLLVGHADTVWPAGTASRWPCERQDGMLSGPGVGDMKACLVAAAHALDAARRVGQLDGIGLLELLIVPDEELGSTASRAWIERRARGAGACLGLEAGWPGGGVVVARGAVGAVRITGRGRSAHAAAHEDTGSSAVAALAELVSELELLSDRDDGVIVNVGVFRGGTARQVVADHAELLVDLRAPDDAAAARLLHDLTQVLRDHERAVPGVAIELEGGITRPGLARARSRELWTLAEARAAELGLPFHPVASRGGSDASFAAALGVPTLDGLGPICHDSCSRAERIEIASLVERGALLACLLCDLAARWR
jgi:glutamate carboxypeptidase